MAIGLQFISGVMVGIEWQYDEKAFIIDLGIIRVIFVWGLGP